MKTVLFICTGNIFRSMTAEHAFRAQIGNTPFEAASAGIEANPQQMYEPVRNRLIALGIDPSAHVQRKLTQKMLDEAALAVAMGEDHQEFIRTHFERVLPLFNQVALGNNTPIPDIWEKVPDWKTNENGRQQYAVEVVDAIWQAMPTFKGNMKNFIA